MREVQLLPLKRFVDSRRPITYGIVQAGENDPTGVRYIRPVDMSDHDGVPDISQLLRTSDAIARTYKRSEVRTGDIIVSIGPSYGKTMLVDDDLAGANLTQGTARVAVDRRHFGPYVRWALRSSVASASWDAAVGGATFRALNLEPLSQTPVPAWPVAKQRAIADYLDHETARIGELIAAKRRMRVLLEERRTTVLLERVAPHLLTARVAPDDWNPTRLKHLFDPPMAGTWGSEPDGSSSDTLCIRVADFDRKRFRVDERAATLRSVDSAARRKCLLKPGDVLIEKSGGGEAQPVGFAVVFDLETDAICSNFVARLRPGLGLEPAFAGYVLAAAYRSRSNVPFVKQTTGIQNLDLSAYLSLPWYVPDTSRQRTICDRLKGTFTTMDRVSQTLDHQIALLEERRQALITAAVTGELDIHEAA